MKILAGSIVRQTPDVLKAHMDTMMWQKVGKNVQVDYLYINDLDIDEPTYKESRDVLYDSYPSHVKVQATEGRPSGAEYSVTQVTHGWNEATFHWLGQLKQQYLDYARMHGYDAVFLVDSDLLLDPYTLQCLIDNELPITSAVFWTAWMPGGPEQPQVWQRHPYDLDGGMYRESEFIKRLRKKELIQVGGLGACTLIGLEGTEGASYYPFLTDLPSGGMWQGEDRHFCVKANRAHIPLYGDGWPTIHHLYRPTGADDILRLRDSLDRTRPLQARYDNYVRLRLQPLEVPDMQGFLHVRGRLPELKLLPELEAHVTEVPIGESAIVKVHFPTWWPIAPGQDTLVKLDVLDAMPYTLPHVGVAERPFYTPAQMAEIANVKLYSKVPEMGELAWVQGDDDISGPDMVESESEGGE